MGTDGAPCIWDERDGCWREADGAPFDPKRAAACKKARQRAAQSDAQARAERDAQAAAQRKLWDNLPAAQRQERCDRSTAVNHKTRGVTPLKQALLLPTGQREQQLLFDTHGSGSAFSTVNSRRLRTLQEGSTLHAECVEDTAKDMQLLCPVDVLDEYRMVMDFVADKKEAEKLPVCGTCGVPRSRKHCSLLSLRRRMLSHTAFCLATGACSLSTWYSDPIKLADLPQEHWARIPDEAYAHLKQADPIEWIKRGEDGTYNEKKASGEDNASRVQIPWHEFHTKFEWAGSAYHVAPEAVEWLVPKDVDRTDDQREDAPQEPHVRICKHCHSCWGRSRGEPLGESKARRHDGLYWQGAPRDSTARGDDLGRLTHLQEEKPYGYGIETDVSRLEQLVLASVRTHYVSYKVRHARYLRPQRHCVPS